MYLRGRALMEAFLSSSRDHFHSSLFSFYFCWIPVRDILAQMLISQQERSQVSAVHFRVICPHMVIFCTTQFPLQRSFRFSLSLPTCYCVVFGPPCWLLSVWTETEDRSMGPQLPPFTASNLLLMLWLSSFLSFFCSGTPWTANRTSWG